jgi:hypothetical protein
VQTVSRPARRLLAVLFAAGLLILLDQSADLIATLLSQKIDPSAANWRFGLFGLVTSRASALLVGDVMLLAATSALGWRYCLKVLGVLHLLTAGGALAGLVFFLLDAVQLRGGVPAQSAGAFSAAVFRAGIMALAGGVTLAWAGVAAWRSSEGRPRDGRSAADTLLVADAKRRRDS